MVYQKLFQYCAKNICQNNGVMQTFWFHITLIFNVQHIYLYLDLLMLRDIIHFTSRTNRQKSISLKDFMMKYNIN